MNSSSASHFLILCTIPTSCKYLFCRFPGPFFVSNITQKFHSIKTSEARVTRIAILCIAIQRYKLIRRFETLPKQKAKTEVLTSFCFAWNPAPSIGILEHGISVCFCLGLLITRVYVNHEDSSTQQMGTDLLELQKRVFSVGFGRMLQGWNLNVSLMMAIPS